MVGGAQEATQERRSKPEPRADCTTRGAPEMIAAAPDSSGAALHVPRCGVHEMSLALGVMQIVEDAARSQGFGQVLSVRLEIGQLAAVEPEALRFCFDAVARDTVAQGATLEILETPGSGWCAQCDATV